MKKQSTGAGRPLTIIFTILGNLAFALLILVMSTLVLSMVQSKLSGGPPTIAGYQLYIVTGGSMSPAFEAGSLALLKPVDPQTIAAGDVITYRPAAGGDTLTSHRVFAVNGMGENLNFATRGDANEVNDPLPVRPAEVTGKIHFTVPYAGYLMSFGHSKAGIVTLIFIPGILIIFFEVRHLIHLAGQWEEEKERLRNAKSDALSEEA